MSINPEHISNIASGTKNHEYRKYLLPSSIQRVWFYTTAPISEIAFIARISGGKTPGQVPENGGIGNEDFNAGRKVSSYGYEILELWRLKEPIGLQLAIQRGYLKGPPQKYVWVSSEMMENYSLHSQEHIILPPKDRNASIQADLPVPLEGASGVAEKEQI